MRRGLLLGVLLAAWMATASPAQTRTRAAVPTQTITVVNQANVKPRNLRRVEYAIQQQALQLRAAWGTPPITFGPGGWEIDLERSLPWAPDDDGYHGEYDTSTYNDATGQVDVTWRPYAEVAMSAAWSVTFSHETLEMLVDPYPSGHGRHGPEVCDPVEDVAYALHGAMVSDFVLSAWFGAKKGPRDHVQSDRGHPA